jgi:hypothetical protein
VRFSRYDSPTLLDAPIAFGFALLMVSLVALLALALWSLSQLEALWGLIKKWYTRSCEALERRFM